MKYNLNLNLGNEAFQTGISKSEGSGSAPDSGEGDDDNTEL